MRILISGSPIAQPPDLSPRTGSEQRLTGEQNGITPGGAVLMHLERQGTAPRMP